MCNLMKCLLLLTISIITVSSGPCGDRLGSKQNTILKRHLPKDAILQSSLDKFEKKFESIKNMPWDYKYRRHTNKIDWDAPKYVARKENSVSEHLKSEIPQKNTVKNSQKRVAVKENFVWSSEKQTRPKKYAKQNEMAKKNESKQENSRVSNKAPKDSFEDEYIE